ncbi:MAG: AMP-binding protein [Candidatus Omnitrophica bacterium]|nr:AMP-binding protein [Candidatus Omnitrophota bacterium]
MDKDMVIHKKFFGIASRFRDRVCLQIKKGPVWERWTYGEIEDLALRIGAFLIREGFKKGDRAALCVENRPEWGIIYLGMMAAGLTCVPLDTQLTGEETENLVNDSGARIMFISLKVFQSKRIDKIKDGLDRIIILDSDTINGNIAGFPEVRTKGAEGVKWPEVFPEDIASLIYTSGTTGEPKGVMLTHKNLCSDFQSIDKMKLFTDKDNFISILPLHHVFPFMVTLVTPLFCRARVTYALSMRSDDLLLGMRDAGVTVLAGVPQIIYMFYTKISEELKKIPYLARIHVMGIMEVLWRIRRASGINLSRRVFSSIHKPFGRDFRLFASGGAKLNEEAAKFLTKVGFTVLEGYGLTETSPVVAFNTPERQKIGSVGRVVPDVELRIDSPDASGVGEIVIKGPNVMKGFFKRPDETRKVITDGWFYSGDLGYTDKDGYLYITGRRKEVIVLSSGKNIYPEEIEAHYAKSPYIKEICVIGVGCGTLEEKLSAVVLPDAEFCRKKGEVNFNAKIRWELENLSDGLAPYQRIKGFIIVKEEIPRTRMGKIRRHEVKIKYLDELKGLGSKGGTETSPVTDEDRKLISSGIGMKVVEVLNGHIRSKRILSPSDHLELDLGIDSLGRVELATALESALDMHISNELMTRAFTVKELILGIEGSAAGEGLQKGPLSPARSKDLWNEILNEEPAQDMIKKIDLSPGRARALGMLLFTGILRLMFRVIWRLRISGEANIPVKGKCVLAVNHESYLDGFIVASSVPAGLRKDLFLVGFRAYFEVPVIRNIVKFIRVIPIDQATRLLEAMQACAYVLKNDKIVCIFPEGERTIDGEIKEFKKGVGILAKELNIPLVPVRITGSHRSWPRTRAFPRPYPISITFGRPFDHEELKKEGLRLGAKDDHEAVSLGIREEVMKLKGG